MTLTNRATRVKGQQPTWGWHEKCVSLVLRRNGYNVTTPTVERSNDRGSRGWTQGASDRYVDGVTASGEWALSVA